MSIQKYPLIKKKNTSDKNKMCASIIYDPFKSYLFLNVTLKLMKFLIKIIKQSISYMK